LQPFEIQTLKTLLTIALTGIVVYFIPTMISPLADIIIRSVVITLLYTGAIYFMRVVPELEPVAMAYLRKIFMRKDG
jgi:hypothetical protein